MLVVLAGAAATLASVVVLRLARPHLLPLLPDTTSALAFAIIETIGEVSLWFALVNVLPLPPLTGAHLIVAIAPHAREACAACSLMWRWRLRRSRSPDWRRVRSRLPTRCWRALCWESKRVRFESEMQ